jgi:3-deoxy-manno-octulosonate cytidylyltransferase (CMP-KDO synthetase)
VRLVARRALDLDLDLRVVVASDDERVLEAVAPLGVEGVLTSPDLRSGTERVAAVAALPQFAGSGIVLNVQGDEPFFPLEAALGAVERVRSGDPIGTAAAPLAQSDLMDPNRVKVVVDGTGRALRFSRVLPASGAWACQVEVLHHIGIYAYERRALERWVKLRPARQEISEGLEQLRPLAHGIPIGVARLEIAAPCGVDTEEDLALTERYAEMMSQRVG